MLCSQKVQLQCLRYIHHAHKPVMTVIFLIKFIPQPISNMELMINYSTGYEEGVILEEDSEDEEGYMFAGQGTFLMFHVVTYISCACFQTHVINYHFRGGHRRGC